MLFTRRQQEAAQQQQAAPQHQKSYSADAIPDTPIAAAEPPTQLPRGSSRFSGAALGGNGSMPGSTMGEIKASSGLQRDNGGSCTGTSGLPVQNLPAMCCAG
jgi:hypothetical protein